MLTQSPCFEAQKREISQLLCDLNNELLDLKLSYSLLIAANSDSGLQSEDELSRLNFLIGQFCGKFSLEKLKDLLAKAEQSHEKFTSLIREID